jgi:phosphoglycerol transferase MdoB-like AlkP superfamily enzyme
MESFGKEYVGKLNNGKGFTPFLDSLIGVSRVYPNAYANAERSSKAIAAIMTSVPSLMDEEIMRSLYQDDCFFGLGTALKEQGYYTSFYHGGITENLIWTALEIWQASIIILVGMNLRRALFRWKLGYLRRRILPILCQSA